MGDMEKFTANTIVEASFRVLIHFAMRVLTKHQKILTVERMPMPALFVFVLSFIDAVAYNFSRMYLELNARSCTNKA